MESNHIWKKNISLDYCLKNEKISLLKKIDWKSINNLNTIYNFLNKTEKLYLNRNFIDNKISIKEENNMYSILEKTILLKSVNLFQNIPGNILSKIAQIALEIHLEEKDVIFKEGDSGSSLFVIISGKVDIIKNNQIIAMPISNQDSSSLSSFAKANILIIRDPNAKKIKRGSLVKAFILN